MVFERTLVMIKPDGVEKSLIGESISRFEKRGLIIENLKMTKLTKEEAGDFYAIHKGKPFFEDLVAYVTRGPVVAMVLAGPQAIRVAREMIGATNPAQSAPGTLRGDYALDITENIIHGSDSPESSQKERALLFPKHSSSPKSGSDPNYPG